MQSRGRPGGGWESWSSGCPWASAQPPGPGWAARLPDPHGTDRGSESTASGVTPHLTFTPLSATHLMQAFGKKLLGAQVS